jgi:hypothetical protein
VKALGQMSKAIMTPNEEWMPTFAPALKEWAEELDHMSNALRVMDGHKDNAEVNACASRLAGIMVSHCVRRPSKIRSLTVTKHL